ncbi:SMI1/KNR4 family protein [Streptomyces sp. NPDC005374]|uniref:SMI1/KNR4 family protein n=1 Tax=Streptomyces sp. NPDC005374 TaxID=3364713 RepID=UPI0036BCB86A
MDYEQRLTHAWDRIDDWLRSHAPASYASLKGPASDADLEALEEAVGVPLSAELILLLRRHNGSTAPHEQPALANAGFFLPRADRLLSAQEISKQHGMRNRLLDEDESGHLSRTWWHRDWIPFTVSNAADALFVDHRRTEGRPEPTFGRVGKFSHDGDAKIQSFSFTEFFEEVAQALSDDSPVLGCTPILRADSGKLGWQLNRGHRSARS